MEPWSINTLVIVFGGGIAGAAFGTLWAVVLCAFFIFVGCAVVLLGGSDFLLLQVGLGPVFGPHVGGFASGIAAAAYAAGIRKNHPTGAAKDILSPLLDTSWDVLVVGGIFALIGHIALQIFVKIPIVNQFDCLALSVVFTNALARLSFQKEMPWGRAESIKKYGYLGTDNYSISWAPWQSPPKIMVVLAFGVGSLSVALAWGLKQQLDPMAAKGVISATDAFVVPLIIGWAIAIINLIALMLGTGSLQKVPLFHCQACLGALGFLLTGSLAVGVAAAIFGALLQELMARMFYNHATSHIDPPATAIAFGTLFMNLMFKPEFLNLAGLFK